MNRFLLKALAISKKAFKRLMEGLSLKTFKGRTLLLLLFFVGTLTGLSSLTIYYNSQIKEINQTVLRLRRPATLHTSEILIGMNSAATMQNGYFLTQTETFRQERRRIWERKITPSIDTLLSLDRQFDIQDVDIGTLKRLLEDYERMQIDLENYFIENSDPTEDYFERSISDSRMGAVNAYIKSYNLDKLIPIQEELITMLTELSEQQENLLQRDIFKVQEELTKFNVFVYSLILACVVIAIILGISVVNTIRKSIKKPTEQIKQLALGKLPEEVPEVHNEMRVIVESGNQLAQHLSSASQFAAEIGNGNFQYDFHPASKEDILGNALLQMRQRLMEIAEADKQQGWVSEGLASFVDILRNTEVDFENLADDIIATLVRYLAAHQGTLFTISQQKASEITLKQSSYYAYDRKKFLGREIKIYDDFAEGIVGQCFIEGTTIYITEVPQNYLKVNSGLGEITPKALLLVPLTFNDKVEGVIEVASLKPLKSYEIEFVEKLAESVAATIYNYKNAERTKRLLIESQEQAEEMRAQEEEMRQNVEELAATQEEMKRKSSELERLLSDAKEKEQQIKREKEESAHLNKMMQDIVDGYEAAIYVINRSGTYTMVDKQFLEIFNAQNNKVLGKRSSDFMNPETALLFTSYHKTVLESRQTTTQKERHKVGDQEITLFCTRFPLYDIYNQPYAVCGILYTQEFFNQDFAAVSSRPESSKTN